MRAGRKAWRYGLSHPPRSTAALGGITLHVTRGGLQFDLSRQPAPDSHIVGLASATPESKPAHRLLSLTRDGNFPLVGFADVAEQQNCGNKGVVGIFHRLYMG